MAGYRSRSRSRSFSPRRRYSRSPPRYRHYDDPRDRYRGGGGGGGPHRGYDYDRPSAPTGLLVRNISLTARCVLLSQLAIAHKPGCLGILEHLT
jgi:FUS-interacting serine-arginine-rich protein 1